GIVLGLAAQSTLGNIFSGISMILAKPFEPDDYITVQTWQYNKMPSTYPHEEYVPGYSGVVKKIGLLYTALVDDSNEPLYVPNGVLNQALVINHRRAATRIIRFRAELNKSVPFSSVEKRIMAILKRYGADKRSYVTMEHLAENTYGVSVNINVENTKVPTRLIKSDLLREILAASNEAAQKKGSGK
ncbi:MAG: mechanosensitive ion channel family protein, partial [Candidatus Micrarchaeaceae archaeon]